MPPPQRPKDSTEVPPQTPSSGNNRLNVPIHTPTSGLSAPIHTPTSGLSNEPLTPNHDNFHTLSGAPRHPRKRKNNDEDAKESADAQKLREFELQVRFTSFRWHSARFYPSVIRSVYGQDISSTDTIYIQAKKKLQDNVHTHKNVWLSKLESNIRGLIGKFPEFSTRSDSEVRKFCADRLNNSTFNYLWYYLDGRINYGKSSPLGQFFFQSKF